MHLDDVALEKAKKGKKRSILFNSGANSHKDKKSKKAEAAVEEEEDVVGPSQPMPFDLKVELPEGKGFTMLVDPNTTTMAMVMKCTEEKYPCYGIDDLTFDTCDNDNMELEPQRTMEEWGVEGAEDYTTTIHATILPRGGRSYFVVATKENHHRCPGCFEFYNHLEHLSQTCSRGCIDEISRQHQVLAFPDAIRERLKGAMQRMGCRQGAADASSVIPPTPNNSEEEEEAAESDVAVALFRDLKLAKRDVDRLQKMLVESEAEAEAVMASLDEKEKQDNFVVSVYAMTADTITVEWQEHVVQISRETGDIVSGQMVRCDGKCEKDCYCDPGYTAIQFLDLV